MCSIQLGLKLFGRGEIVAGDSEGKQGSPQRTEGTEEPTPILYISGGLGPAQEGFELPPDDAFLGTLGSVATDNQEERNGGQAKGKHPQQHWLRQGGKEPGRYLRISLRL